ncbi:hypothetical protein ACO0M4_17165 [Streptomyces sp. RGM 3693]|uniref:hypothetical protein n=1 Tax=Streptomyces sp. RGM 3693 TaxID=3413284 RepID=UPI003D2D8675
MREDESYKTDEFGESHAGRVGVLLEDRSVPEPVYFGSASGSFAQQSTHWSVYDGRRFHGRRAHVLRGVCACGWTGTEYPLDWERIGDIPLREDEEANKAANQCLMDWDKHIEQVEASTVTIPEEIIELLDRTELALTQLTTKMPAVALKAARRLEILAKNTGYHAATPVQRTMEPEEVGEALGITAAQAKNLLARFAQRR